MPLRDGSRDGTAGGAGRQVPSRGRPARAESPTGRSPRCRRRKASSGTRSPRRSPGESIRRSPVVLGGVDAVPICVATPFSPGSSGGQSRSYTECAAASRSRHVCPSASPSRFAGAWTWFGADDHGIHLAVHFAEELAVVAILPLPEIWRRVGRRSSTSHRADVLARRRDALSSFRRLGRPLNHGNARSRWHSNREPTGCSRGSSDRCRPRRQKRCAG